jgi:hypothetical protein
MNTLSYSSPEAYDYTRTENWSELRPSKQQFAAVSPLAHCTAVPYDI